MKAGARLCADRCRDSHAHLHMTAAHPKKRKRNMLLNLLCQQGQLPRGLFGQLLVASRL